MLTIVDDHSRATWIFLLHHKSQTISTFSSFINMIQTQFNAKIKAVRNDNGGEFTGTEFLKLLNPYGIQHQRTCPYTPQQNGVVECKHRHLLQLARSLMIQATMPQQFWPYSLLMATHIINRLPTSLLNWKTPYKLLQGKQPNYSSLKIFGCLCYATNTKPHVNKFEPRAHKCVYLGFSPGRRGSDSKIWILSKFFVSRDVIFYEHISPFNISCNNNEISIPLPVTNYVCAEK